MRIYNATNAQLNLPYPGGTVSIAPHSVSGNLGANTQTISLLVSAYTTDEIAFIVSGPFELNLCSSIPTVVNYVVQSLEEAIEKLEPRSEIKKEEVTIEEEKIEEEPKVEIKKEKKHFVKKEAKKVEPKVEKVEDTVITIAESEEKPEGPAVEEPEVFHIFDETMAADEVADDEKGEKD